MLSAASCRVSSVHGTARVHEVTVTRCGEIGGTVRPIPVDDRLGNQIINETWINQSAIAPTAIPMSPTPVPSRVGSVSTVMDVRGIVRRAKVPVRSVSYRHRRWIDISMMNETTR